MKTLLIVVGLVFAMILLGTTLGFVPNYVAVIAYLVLIAFAAAASVFIAHTTPVRLPERQ
jgi:hypothetical protein